MRRTLFLALAAACGVFGQKYNGPPPPKPDLPYLKHGDRLVPTEALTAREDRKGSQTVYTLDGPSSTAKTPLVLPVFLLLADRLDPDKFGLYRLQSKDGHREIVFDSKNPPEPIHLQVKHLDGKLYWIEADDPLDPGEYSLSPEGSNQAFCFQVY